jgi:type VI protein secretion system component VasK
MNFWEFVLIITIAGMIYSAWKSKHLAKLGAFEDEKGKIHQLGSGREAELEREVQELRERVKVLERIATDGRDTRLLSDEIEKLRDK